MKFIGKVTRVATPYDEWFFAPTPQGEAMARAAMVHLTLPTKRGLKDYYEPEEIIFELVPYQGQSLAQKGDWRKASRPAR